MYIDNCKIYIYYSILCYEIYIYIVFIMIYVCLCIWQRFW